MNRIYVSNTYNTSVIGGPRSRSKSKVTSTLKTGGGVYVFVKFMKFKGELLL